MPPATPRPAQALAIKGDQGPGKGDQVISVRAKAIGFHRYLREVGDVFQIKERDFSDSWMVRQAVEAHPAEVAARPAPVHAAEAHVVPETTGDRAVI